MYSHDFFCEEWPLETSRELGQGGRGAEGQIEGHRGKKGKGGEVYRLVPLKQNHSSSLIAGGQIVACVVKLYR